MIHLKNVVITGSTRGIGFAMAKEFLQSGCCVTLSGRGETLAGQALEELGEAASHTLYVPCNVQKMTDLQNLWDLSAQRWGHIDIWINNAGQNAPHDFVFETDEHYVERIIGTNITGMIFGSQVAAKGMLRQGFGAIYSMEGLGSNNMVQKKTILYGTTKAALTYFMKGLAKELEGTRVIAGRLAPGMMLTDFITKTPDGKEPAVMADPSFKRIFNILADKPETVAAFLVPKMLANTKNGAQIQWLSNAKAGGRFIKAPFKKRKLIE